MVNKLSLATVQNKIIELGKIINAPEDSLFMWTKTDHLATPHFELKDDFYHFIIIDRGTEVEHLQTKDINLLLYWYFQGVTSEMATRYELSHRIPNQDFRRIYFAKWINLLGILNPLWAKWLKKELNEVLERAPYSDRGNL